jgi:hypothetical protein
MLRLATEPPLLPRRLWPRTAVANMVETVVLPVLDAVLDRIDITQLILEHVSIPRILDAVDVDAVVARVNLSPIIDRVLSEIDLPEIVRSSSDSMFSDAVLGVRLESASGDEMVDRIVGRILRRGRDRGTARDAGKPSMP